MFKDNYRVLEQLQLHRLRLIVAAIVAVYILLGVGRALTTEPWNDEAWYVSPSQSLIQYGNTGTPLLETTGKFWAGIHQHTYWVMPLAFFVQVPWFKLFGFSLLTARLQAMVYGLVALLSWGSIVYRLTKDVVMAVVVMALLACDYQFVSQTAIARMDAMALAFASVAILLYLKLREQNMKGAIFFSQLGVVACGLTHPTPGIPAFVTVLFLTLYLDGRRLRWTDVLISILPYLAGLAFLTWYISPDPQLFRHQFFGNVYDIDRLGGITHPLQAITREFGKRYVEMAGFGRLNPLYRIKVAAMAVYAIAAMALLSDRRARREPGIRALLWMWGVYAASIALYDNTKEVKYAIHIVAFFDAIVAAWIVEWWRRGGSRQFAAIGGAALFAVVNTGGLLYTSLIQDNYRRSFLPAAQFLEHNAARSDLILAASKFGFPLGFDRNIVDDSALTYETHKAPEFVVIGAGYRLIMDHSRTAAPEVYDYFTHLLQNKYRVVYSRGDYQIYERNKRISSGNRSVK